MGVACSPAPGLPLQQQALWGSRPLTPTRHSAPTTPSRVDLASLQLFQQLLVKNNFFRACQLPSEPLCNPQAPDTRPWWLGPQSQELQTGF